MDSGRIESWRDEATADESDEFNRRAFSKDVEDMWRRDAVLVGEATFKRGEMFEETWRPSNGKLEGEMA